GSARPAWVDPNRTLRYSDRRSIADRLRNESREPAEPAPEIEPVSTLGQRARPKPASSAQLRAVRRSGRGLRLASILTGGIVLGLPGGGGAVWFSGGRPSFLGTTTADAPKPGNPAQPAGDTKPETKPGDPSQPVPPPASEIGRNCFSGANEVKAGSAAC